MILYEADIVLSKMVGGSTCEMICRCMSILEMVDGELPVAIWPRMRECLDDFEAFRRLNLKYMHPGAPNTILDDFTDHLWQQVRK